MQSSSTFINMPGLIPEVKKSALISDYENIIACLEEYKQGENSWTSVVVPNTFADSVGQCHLRKIVLFFGLYESSLHFQRK